METSYEHHSDFGKTSLSEKFWQAVRFLVVTGMIFAVSFFALNFEAYKSILANVINPGALQAKTSVLEKAAGVVDIDESLLLPVLNGEKEVKKSFAWFDSMVVTPTDNRLVVPDLGINVPLVGMGTEHIEGENWHDLENEIQESLRSGVLHYPGTAEPGETGNFFLTGHSSYYSWDPGEYKSVFASLSKLEIGAVYYVYWNQKKFTYKVIERKIVDPSDVSVLQQPHDKEIATMMTCYPTGTVRERFLTISERVR